MIDPKTVVFGLIQRFEFFGAMLKSNRFTRSALAVAFVLLYRHFNGRTGQCNPSTATLADETGVTPRAVKKAIIELTGSGWWNVVRGGGRGRTNTYMPRLDALKGEPQFTNTGLQRVNRRSPIQLQKGEQLSTKRVNRRSPEPVKNQNRTVDLHRPVARSARARVCPEREPGWRQS